MNRPSPKVGDWLQAKGPNSDIKLKFYSHPPIVLSMCNDPRFRSHEYDAEVQPGQFIGPVHLVCQDHHSLVSVLVPHPQSSQLAWMNIWGYGIKYCRIVTDDTLACWFRQGIRNTFAPDCDVEYERILLRELQAIRWQPGSYRRVYPCKRRKI